MQLLIEDRPPILPPIFMLTKAAPAEPAAHSYQDLYQHAIDALSSGDPAFQVQTPGWADKFGGKPSETLEYVLNDSFAGPSDTTLASVIKLIGASLQSPDPVVRMTAQALAVNFGHGFARFHEGS